MSEQTSGNGASGVEAKRIHDIVRRVGGAQGFPYFELTFGKDSTGDDAVWIYFDLDPTYASGHEEIKRLDSLVTLVKDALFENHILRVPYVRFRERKVAQGR